MPNPFAKSRKTESPYAIYSYGGIMTWHVLKTYKMPKSEDKDPYARWRYGTLVAATPEWLEAYDINAFGTRKRRAFRLPTPEEYLAERV
jgi:hypothetical protein